MAISRPRADSHHEYSVAPLCTTLNHSLVKNICLIESHKNNKYSQCDQSDVRVESTHRSTRRGGLKEKKQIMDGLHTLTYKDNKVFGSADEADDKTGVNDLDSLVRVVCGDGPRADNGLGCVWGVLSHMKEQGCVL